MFLSLFWTKGDYLKNTWKIRIKRLIIKSEVHAEKKELKPSNGPIVNVKQGFALDSWAYNVANDLMMIKTQWNEWISELLFNNWSVRVLNHL